ncbi:MAG: hypothetical protein ACXW30_02970 [Micavibrio sp.]
MTPLLPEASILEKLNRHDSNAAATIMTMAEEIGERRREQEKSLSASFFRACQRGWKNFGISMILYPGPYTLTPPSPEALNLYEQAVKQRDKDALQQDFARVGDSLRLAIGAYMTQSGLSADKIGLTPAERGSLTLLEPDSALQPGRTGFFRKIFPKL